MERKSEMMLGQDPGKMGFYVVDGELVPVPVLASGSGIDFSPFLKVNSILKNSLDDVDYKLIQSVSEDIAKLSPEDLRALYDEVVPDLDDTLTASGNPNHGADGRFTSSGSSGGAVKSKSGRPKAVQAIVDKYQAGFATMRTLGLGTAIGGIAEIVDTIRRWGTIIPAHGLRDLAVPASAIGGDALIGAIGVLAIGLALTVWGHKRNKKKFDEGFKRGKAGGSLRRFESKPRAYVKGLKEGLKQSGTNNPVRAPVD